MKGKRRIELRRELESWERSVLEEGDLYLVGGTIRDLLLGLEGESVDEDYLVTGIDLDRVVSILNRYGKTNLVGRSFGVIKFTRPDGETIDVSLPRTEFSTGPGHRDFDVRFDPSIPVEEDLARRDFTVNSMAFHLGTSRLVDPLGGLADLDKRMLRINRPGSFREDPLRILRGVQFSTRFGFDVEENTKELMKRDGELLLTVSSERIREELNKLLLKAERPSRGFVFMHDTGLLRYILPKLEETYGVEQNEYHPDDIFTHSLKSCDAARPELHLRWSALLHDLGKKKMKKEVDGRVVFYRHEEESALIAESVLTRLQFSGEAVKRISHLVRQHMFNITEEWTDAAIRRFIARVGEDNIKDLFDLRYADAVSMGNRDIEKGIAGMRERVSMVLESDAAFKREDLAVNGSDVMRTLGLEAGRDVGDVLRTLLEMVLENPELNTREKLIEIMNGMKKNQSP